MKVYELVDVSDEEVYFTLGMYSTQAKAEAAIMANDGPEEGGDGGRGRVNKETYDTSDDERLEVREHELDRSAERRDSVTVATYLRTWTWTDDGGDVVWSTEEVP